MAKKAEKAKKNNKNLIICICACAAVVVIAIVVAVILLTRGPVINDDYFVTDDNKYVVNMDEPFLCSSEHEPTKEHYVFNHSGSEITSTFVYCEYKDEEAAKTAFESYKDIKVERIKDVSLKNKYIAIEYTEEEWEGFTIDDIKSMYETSYDFDYDLED